MPIVGAVLGTQIFAKFTTKGFVGAQASSLAMAVGNGLITSILATNTYSGVTVGTGVGSGIGTGKVIGLVGPVVGQNIFTMMGSSGLTGAQSLNMAMAIGEAFAEHITTFGIINSSGGPVAIGSGNGVILGIIGPALGASIVQFFTSTGFTGTQSPQLAMAIGNGVAMSMAVSTVTTTIVGAIVTPLPIPSVGVEIGKLI